MCFFLAVCECLLVCLDALVCGFGCFVYVLVVMFCLFVFAVFACLQLRALLASQSALIQTYQEQLTAKERVRSSVLLIDGKDPASTIAEQSVTIEEQNGTIDRQLGVIELQRLRIAELESEKAEWGGANITTTTTAAPPNNNNSSNSALPLTLTTRALVLVGGPTDVAAAGVPPTITTATTTGPALIHPTESVASKAAVTAEPYCSAEPTPYLCRGAGGSVSRGCGGEADCSSSTSSVGAAEECSHHASAGGAGVSVGVTVGHADHDQHQHQHQHQRDEEEPLFGGGVDGGDGIMPVPISKSKKRKVKRAALSAQHAPLV